MALPISSVGNILKRNLLPALVGTWLPVPQGCSQEASEIWSKSSLHIGYSQPQTQE